MCNLSVNKIPSPTFTFQIPQLSSFIFKSPSPYWFWFYYELFHVLLFCRLSSVLLFLKRVIPRRIEI